jgi:hypothetical protein
MRTRSARRTEWSKPLLTLAAVFLVVALWNGVLALVERTLWLGGTAAACALASAALMTVAVTDRHD